MLKRFESPVLRRAGHAGLEVAKCTKLAAVSLGSVRRVEREPEVTQIEIARDRERHAIGRPTQAEPFRSLVIAHSGHRDHRTSVSLATIWRAIERLGFTIQKTVHADDQRRPDVVAARRQWREQP